MNWSLLISILVGAFLVVSFLISMKKGFLRSVLTLAAWLAAIFAAAFLVGPISGALEGTVKVSSPMVLKAIVLAGLILVILLALRILLIITKWLEKVPLLKGFNRFLGGLLGLCQGLLWIWLAGILIMAISGTPFGKQIVELIHGSSFLTFLYDGNLIVWAFTNWFHLF